MPSQEGRDEPEYPKLSISSQVVLSTALHPLNGWRDCPRMSTFYHGWYWTPRSDCRKGQRWEKSPSSSDVMKLQKESAWQRLWRGQRKTTDSEHNRLDKPEGTDTVDTNSHMRSVEFSHVALENPLAKGIGQWLKLIPFITTFDLIH